MLELVAGLVIVGIILFDVFQGVVVPRPTGRMLRVAPLLLYSAWPLWRRVGVGMQPAQRREAFLGTFAPFGLLLMLSTWVASLIFGYGLALHALQAQIKPQPHDLGTACYLAGTSLFTLGFGDLVATGGLARAVLLAAAASGLALVALVISLMFTLYASFQRREVQVLTLDSRAGAPPSGVAMLETYGHFGLQDELQVTFAAWEIWSAEVLESHLAYPLLAYLRSSHNDESWISSLGAVLDAATLLLTTVEGGPQGAAHMMYGLGTHAVLDLSDWFGLPRERQVGVERLEFDDARQRLAKVGFQLREAEDAWRSFSELRSLYAVPLNSMARHFATPPTQWIGDRSILSHLHPSQSQHERHHPASQTEGALSATTTE